MGPVQAGRVLAALGHVNAFGHVSRRVATDRFEITVAGDLGALHDHEVVDVEIHAAALPAGAPAEAWLHAEIFRRRPDVGAVARAQPLVANAAAAATEDQVPVVNGQSAWLLGPSAGIPVHRDPRLLRSRELAGTAATTLGGDHALLLRGNGAVTVGSDAESAAARMHLLAAACEIWLRAASVRGVDVVVLSAAERQSWRAVGDELMPRLWRHLARSTQG